MKRRLIVGSAGIITSFGIIRSVREHWGDSVFVVAIDSNRRELAAASVLADAFVQVPLARSAEFPSSLERLAESYPDSWYLPMHDEEIEIAACLAAEGKLPAGLKLIAPPCRVVRLCNDKWAMHQWLNSRGLPSPPTSLATAEAIATARWPLMLKPRFGFGSHGVRCVGSPDEIGAIDPEQWLLQEVLHEPDVSVDGFLSRSTSRFRSLCREILDHTGTAYSGAERQLRWGDQWRPSGTMERMFDDQSLAGILERLMRGLPLFGPVVLNMMRSLAGGFRIIDVNPRVGGAMRMCACVGFDPAAANLADVWGEPSDDMLKSIVGEHYVVREYAEYVTTGESEGSR